jgi:hypothetical protein
MFLGLALPHNVAALPDAAASTSLHQRFGSPRRKPLRYTP